MCYSVYRTKELMSMCEPKGIYSSHNATLEKTGDEDCMTDDGHLCPTEAYNQRRMFFHGCVSELYIHFGVSCGVEVVL